LFDQCGGEEYGHQEILVSFRHRLDCGRDFAERRTVLRAHRAPGATRAKKFGGYETE